MSNVKKCIQFNTQQTMISNLYVNIIDNKVFLCAFVSHNKDNVIMYFYVIFYVLGIKHMVS